MPHRKPPSLRPPPREPWDTFDLIEAFHLGHAISSLHELGILERLAKPTRAATLARATHTDPQLLKGALEFVAARTGLVRRSTAGFVLDSSYDLRARHLLDLYVGAFGPNAIHLGRLLHHPSQAPRLVDRSRHARAFQRLDDSPASWIAGVIHQLGLNHLLDLGCASGDLLRQLAAARTDFVGWGVERNPLLLRAARRQLRDQGLSRRVRIFDGDAFHLSAVVPDHVRSQLRVVTACQIANELFRDGPDRTTRWLRHLRRLFPGRLLLLSDYYGALGSRDGSTRRETLLHDFAQLISGQGVPPSGLRPWRRIYASSGCRLLHVIEDTRTTRFLHLVRL